MINKNINNITDETPAKRLKELRSAYSITQTELAEHIDSHQVVISRIERGQEKLSPAMAARLANYFGVDTNFLYEGISEEVINRANRLSQKLSEVAPTLSMSAMGAIEALIDTVQELDHPKKVFSLQPQVQTGRNQSGWVFGLRELTSYIKKEMPTDFPITRMSIYRSLDVAIGNTYMAYPELYVTGNTPYMSFILKSVNGQDGVYYIPDLYDTEHSDIVANRNKHAEDTVDPANQMTDNWLIVVGAITNQHRQVIVCVNSNRHPTHKEYEKLHQIIETFFGSRLAQDVHRED